MNTAVVSPVIWQSGLGLPYFFSEILDRKWLRAMQSTCAVSLLKFWMHQTFSARAGEFSSSCTLNPTNPGLRRMDSRTGSLRGFIFHMETCDMRGARCVRVHFPARQAVGSDLLPESAIPYKRRQQASREQLLPRSWHSKCAPGFSILLLLQMHPQRQTCSPSLQVWMAPSHGGHTLLLSGDVGVTEESGVSQHRLYILAPGA